MSFISVNSRLGIHATKGTSSLFGKNKILKINKGVLFILIWGGAVEVTVNAKILGGKVSFLYSVRVLGYCIFPINLAAIAISIMKFVRSFLIKFLIVIVIVAFL